jgi:hypothetical protein
MDSSDRLNQFCAKCVFKEIRHGSRHQGTVYAFVTSVRAEDNDFGCGMLSPNQFRCFGAGNARQAKIHQRHVRLEPAEEVNPLFASACLANELHAGL